MTPRRHLTDPGSGAPAQGRRGAVLRLLREADGPVSVAHVAESIGIHLNTARFHLDTLVNDGLATRDTARRDEPGRPKVVYSAVAAEGPEGARSFRLLADILLGAVSSAEDPVAAATRAGRAWGAYLADAPAPTERVSAEDGERRLVASLEDIGFVVEAEREPYDEPEPEPGRAQEPVSVPAVRAAEPTGPARTAGPADGAAPVVAAAAKAPSQGAGLRLRLHHCPFLEVAQRRPDIICAIHLGLMQGTVETLRAPLATEDLKPFVTPHLCVATLRRTGSV